MPPAPRTTSSARRASRSPRPAAASAASASASCRWTTPRCPAAAGTPRRPPSTRAPPCATRRRSPTSATRPRRRRRSPCPILNESGILQVAPTLTYAGLTTQEGAAAGEPDRYYPSGQRTFGRVIPADNVEAAALATAMHGENCVEAAVVDDPAPGGEGLAPLVAREARSLGLDVVAVERVPDPPSGLRPLADRIERSSADCLFVGSGADRRAVAALLDAAARRASVDALLRPRGARPGGAARPPVRPPSRTSCASRRRRLPPQAWPRPAQRFFRAFAQRYGHAPAADAIFGYEAMMRGPPRDRRGGRARQRSRRGRQAVLRHPRPPLRARHVRHRRRRGHHAVRLRRQPRARRAGSSSTESSARSSPNRLSARGSLTSCRCARLPRQLAAGPGGGPPIGRFDEEGSLRYRRLAASGCAVAVLSLGAAACGGRQRRQRRLWRRQ